MTDGRLAPRATYYRGTKMRSRLEAHWAQRLDELQVPWIYEPFCFADETGQYLPDFRIALPTGRVMYLEVKGTWPLDLIPALQGRMEVVWSSEPDTLLMLAIAGDVWTGTKDEGWTEQVELPWPG